MKDWANNLTTKYPRSYFKDRLLKTDPKDWSIESWKIAETQSYPFIYENDSIDQDY